MIRKIHSVLDNYVAYVSSTQHVPSSCVCVCVCVCVCACVCVCVCVCDK